MAGSFDIGGRKVGDGAPGYLIAEVAQAHDGSLGTAHAFIDAAAQAGADAIKFQTHLAEAESTRDEPFRVPFSRIPAATNTGSAPRLAPSNGPDWPAMPARRAWRS